MADNKLPSGIDRVVGQRIRWRRKELKLTQEKLGDLLGLTFQQVQKYEKGVNRVSAGRLFEMSSAMGVPITYFFDGAETFFSRGESAVMEEDDEILAPVMTSEVLDLIAAFQKIEDHSLRKSLLATVQAAATAFESKQQGED